MTVAHSDEILRLRAAVRDLLAPSIIPEQWVGREPEFYSHLRNGGADLEWLGAKYSLVNQAKNFTEHEQKLLTGKGKVLSTRYRLLFNAEVVARSSEIFNGLPEDH
jgi:hypothetical protein